MLSLLIPRGLGALRAPVSSRIFIASRLAPRLRPFSLSSRILAARTTTRSTTARSTTAKPGPKPKRASTATATKAKPAAKTKAPATKAKKAVKAKKPRARTATATRKKPVGRPRKAAKPKVKKVKPAPAYIPQPKLAVRPFAMFVAENMARFYTPELQSTGGSPMPKVLPLLSAAWKELPAAEKQVYHDRYQQNKVNAQAARAEWAKGITSDIHRAINRERKSKGKKRLVLPKDPDVPPPLSPFFIYLGDRRKEPGAMSSKFSDMAPRTKQWAADWNAMPETEKASYMERAHKMKAASDAAQKA